MVKHYWAILILGLIVVPGFPTALRAGSPAQSNYNLIAVVKQRIETGRFEVRVYQGKRLVQLAPFMDMVIVTPLPGQPKTIENLTNRSVGIVRSQKHPNQWEVYQDSWGSTGGVLTLADNVFKVKQVLISSEQNPILLRLDEKVVRLNPGDALLVL